MLSAYERNLTENPTALYLEIRTSYSLHSLKGGYIEDYIEFRLKGLLRGKTGVSTIAHMKSNPASIMNDGSNSLLEGSGGLSK